MWIGSISQNPLSENNESMTKSMADNSMFMLSNEEREGELSPQVIMTFQTEFNELSQIHCRSSVIISLIRCVLNNLIS